jgi:hypothetical protein
MAACVVVVVVALLAVVITGANAAMSTDRCVYGEVELRCMTLVHPLLLLRKTGGVSGCAVVFACCVCCT